MTAKSNAHFDENGQRTAFGWRTLLNGYTRGYSEADLELLTRRLVERQTGIWHECHMLSAERGKINHNGELMTAANCPCGECRKARNEGPNPFRVTVDGRLGRPIPQG